MPVSINNQTEPNSRGQGCRIPCLDETVCVPDVHLSNDGSSIQVKCVAVKSESGVFVMSAKSAHVKAAGDQAGLRRVMLGPNV